MLYNIQKRFSKEDHQLQAIPVQPMVKNQCD